MTSSELHKSVLKWLAYFDVFRHPLKALEISEICNKDELSVKECLMKLESRETVFRSGEYWSIQSNIEELKLSRLKKEAAAQHYFKKLPRFVKIIRKMPFVKAIAISGSLSKNVMYEDGDIDYFIITTENRLWICRTFLIMFKKVFLFNSHKYFCVNYFVDEVNLKLIDENIFTAVELSYLLPVYNQKVLEELKVSNEWVKTFIPQFTNPIPVETLNGKMRIQKFLEFPFKGKFGEKIDLYFMKLTYKRWRKKFDNFPEVTFDQTMRTKRGVSKHHPRDFQNKVLNAYQEKLAILNIKE